MTTTTPSFTYRAQTDKATKTWHLGAAEKDACASAAPGSWLLATSARSPRASRPTSASTRPATTCPG